MRHDVVMTGDANAAVKIGTILEVPTANGGAYVQVCGRHPNYGWLVRALPGLFAERPDLEALVRRPSRFVTFFAPAPYLDRGDLDIVGSTDVPTDESGVPVMKVGLKRPDGSWRWWTWDGEREVERAALTPEEANLPVRGVVNLALLRTMIVTDWEPWMLEERGYRGPTPEPG